MVKGLKLRKMVATLAMAASVLAPAGLILGQASPASAASDYVLKIEDIKGESALLLPAVQAAREAAAR